jgi:hypothetical protein
MTENYVQTTDEGLIPVGISAATKALDARLRSRGLVRKGKGRATTDSASNPEATATAAYEQIRRRWNFRTTQAADGRRG